MTAEGKQGQFAGEKGVYEPVILLADPPLHADIMMRSSMMESLILGLPDWTTNTSFSRTLVRILTLVSPFCPGGQPRCPAPQAGRRQDQELTLENCVSSASAGDIPKFSQICPVRAGQELPANMSVLRIVADARTGSEGEGRNEGMMEEKGDVGKVLIA